MISLRLTLFFSFIFFAHAQDKPNFIFFIADDISQSDFGTYGHPSIKTPAVDALAAKGMRFDNAYLTTSSCSPSLCSIISGRYPHNTGAPELHMNLPDGQIRFPELLRKAGYYTLLCGKNHMFGDQDRAFDKITRGEGPGNEKNWVPNLKERPKDKPFFFWYASSDAHRSWQLSDHAPTYDENKVIVPPYMYDGPETRKDLAQYYHEVSRFDHFIGLVVEELKEQGILENTMLIVASDNGRPFPRDKSRLYDSGIKTPWVVHFPQIIKEKKVTQSLISSIDLSATCLELAGVEIPKNIQGKSFLPILKNPETKVRQVIFAEHNWHVYKNHERMVRIGDFVYIKNNYPKQMNLSYESDTKYPAGKELWLAHAASKTSKVQQQIFANPCPEEELYKVSQDPDQLNNLASNPEYKTQLIQAREMIQLWTEQTGDSIPKKPTPHRHAPPKIKNGKINPSPKYKVKSPHAEWPGQSKQADKINHPGPIVLP